VARRGDDLVRRIPASRVYHVERTVEQFEEEVGTLRDQVESVADDLRTKLLGCGGGERSIETESASRSESISTDVERSENDESGDSDSSPGTGEFDDGDR
jgi:hypothetical protein